ncbi:MAG: hypothetical protein JXB35_03960 [Anaerolineae bacterium]|nr:hypothetical protein [Anaerolineae bacterium]
MAYAYVIGKTLVGAEEFSEKVALGLIQRFQDEARRNPQARLALRNGTVTAAEAEAHAQSTAPGFTPIGIGKPMSLEILSIYTGNAPGGLFGKPDLLVTTAIKAPETFDAAPRAINQLVADIEDGQFLEPSALADGSPIVYYTPSLVTGTTLCAFELVVESINKNTFENVSKLFNAAAGLPVFAPASAYLIGGTFVLKIVADLSKALESAPFLRAGIDLRFDTPEVPQAIASQIVVFNTRDAQEIEAYEPRLLGSSAVNQRVALVHKQTGKEYAGDAPYMIVSLDGRQRDELNDFNPRLASAALLERFYGPTDTGGQVVAALESAMTLYNDFTYFQKIQDLQKQIKALDPNSPTYQKDKESLEKLLRAYQDNLREEVFKQATG